MVYREDFMGLFDKLREPIVLKEDSCAKDQIAQLNSVLQISSPDIRSQIEQDIRFLQYGLYGEEALMFELKNSHMPMYIMHDLFFEMNGLKTQIDFLVITRKLVIIIECKNLYGNITIDNNGNFIRTVQIGKHYNKQGIYSPITQNQRHIDMIRELRRVSKSVLARPLFEKNFDSNYKSIVVLSNPKSILNMQYAPKEIKEKVVKVDGLISYIKKLHDLCNNGNMSDDKMKKLADFFLEKSVPNNQDYTEKYRSAVPAHNTAENAAVLTETSPTESIPNTFSRIDTNIEETPVYKALKNYRYTKSKEEGIKAYFIYSNAEMEEIIRINPKSLSELKNVKGFGDVKCQKYGNDILEILSENTIQDPSKVTTT